MTDETPFGTALHDRVRSEHPDLDELVRSATVAGRRLRRRRQVGAAAAGVAGVAVVALGVGLLSGPDGTTSDGALIATQPTSAPGQTAGPDEQADLRSDLERLSMAAGRQPGAQDSPIVVTAPGWECDAPADQKFTCSRRGASVVVTWRPAEGRDSYLDPGKAEVAADASTFVSEANGSWFATVAPVQGATQAEVDEVGRSLVWVRR
ncbi:hypothetical protein GCM10027062_00370 [Nocardioides hungaricus]